MRSFRLPPKPVATLAILALVAMPLMWLSLLPQITAGMLVQAISGDGSFPSDHWLARAADKVLSRRYTADQRLLVGLAGPGEIAGGSSYLNRLAAARPESLVIQTRWTLAELSHRDTPLTERLALIDKIEKTDPENSLWPLVRAWVLMEDAATLETLELPPDAPKGTPAPQKLTISDQAQFEQGIAELRRALAMPKYETRSRDLFQMQLDAFGPVNNLSDSIRLIALAAANLLPDLQMVRGTQRFSLQYGAQLLEQGKVEEARPLLRAWRPLAERQLASSDDTLIGALVTGALLHGGANEEDAWRKVGQTAEADQVAALWKPLFQPFDDFRKRQKEPVAVTQMEAFGYRAGILPALLLPALKPRVLPSDSEAFAWRQLEYQQFVEAGVLLLSSLVLWIGLVIGLLVYGFRKRQEEGGVPGGEDVWSWPDLGRAAAWVLLSLGAYLLFERGWWIREVLALPSGNMGHLAGHYIVGVVVLGLALKLALFLPRFSRRDWRTLPGRALVPPALLGLFCVGLVCFSSLVEVPRLVRQAKFMQLSSAGFTQIEAEVTQEFKAEMRQALEAAQKSPAAPAR